jgi:hypothetical protein
VIGARVLGGGTSREVAPRSVETPAAPQAVVAPTTALDAAPPIDAGDLPSTTPADAAVADAPNLPKARPRDTTRPIDAGRSPIVPREQPPVVDSVLKTPVAPSQKPPPQVPPPIDRDATINPFKRGSAAP